MKNIFLILVLLMGNSMFLSASEIGDTQIGIELSTYGQTTKVDDGTYSITDGDLSFGRTLKVTNNFNFGRVGLYLGNAPKQENISTTYFELSYDYMYYTDGDFTPFAGLVIGATFADFDGVDISGLNIGFQVGSEYKLSDNLELDFGFRYLSSSATGLDDQSDLSTIPFIIDITEYETNAIAQYFISLNYKL